MKMTQQDVSIQESRKPFWKSRSIVSAIIALVLQFLKYYNMVPEDIDPEVIDAISDKGVEVVTGESTLYDLGSVIFTAMAAYFRATAKSIVSGSLKNAITWPFRKIASWFK